MANYLIDVLFLVDIVVIFNSCFIDENLRLIEDRKAIACSYIKGWLAVDVLAIIPFDLMFGGE